VWRAVLGLTLRVVCPQNFFETKWLKSAVFNPNVIFVVAEDTETNEILGTASVLLDYSAQSDLCGEFGRLVVHPDARGRGIGNILMEERLKLAAKYLHVAVVENRCVHPRSQAVSARAGFHCVGFLPEVRLQVCSCWDMRVCVCCGACVRAFMCASMDGCS